VADNKYTTFSEFNQARVSLKMMLINYAWFSSIMQSYKDDCSLIVNINYSDPMIEKIVPKTHKNVPIHLHYL
jgi:hypothetical protein